MRKVPTFLGYLSVQGLYLDDQMSGYTIYNNTFFDVQTGIMIGGGLRNVDFPLKYVDFLSKNVDFQLKHVDLIM